MRFVKHTGAPPYRLFEEDDGSKEQRLNAIYNSWKHSDSRVADSELPSNGSLPVWLVKSGIRSNRCELSFAELREMILDYRGNAKWFSEELPRRIVEHRRSRAEGVSNPDAPEVQA
jgi:hypothetical protein